MDKTITFEQHTDTCTGISNYKVIGMKNFLKFDIGHVMHKKEVEKLVKDKELQVFIQ